ncbi:hypothetical protein BCV69DRAFT_595 [Microstroma glucosiphilum]|uniref:Uncharacterized protein n=1 Tax=Pseudomicrostroma glucosiphilum TaxID=1684307 RepID=A0A316UE80_9BASI|nr:hypothetical protein BCV69DRAFT_595 [Pseudomicrostroma glucosiphilum]PWN23492.1 hypothetical protein BCV69DRAFT_595 [Pseudomicrostroma glucosiphilum]
MKLLVILLMLAHPLAIIATTAPIQTYNAPAAQIPGQTTSEGHFSTRSTVGSLAARSGDSDPPFYPLDTPGTSQATSHRLPLPPPGMKQPVGSRYHPLPPPPKSHSQPPRKTRSDIGPERPAYPLPLPKTYSADFSSSRHQPRRRPKKMLAKVFKSMKSFKKLFGRT